MSGSNNTVPSWVVANKIMERWKCLRDLQLYVYVIPNIESWDWSGGVARGVAWLIGYQYNTMLCMHAVYIEQALFPAS